MNELASLVGEPGDDLRQDHPTFGGLGLSLDYLGFEFLGEPVHPRGRKLNLPIQVLHEGFGVAREDVGLAASSRRLPAGPLAVWPVSALSAASP
jgi:hypothetical protein